MSENSRYDITALRARMNDLQGQRYWRGLEELADTQEFQEFLHREFPEDASVWEDGVSRRNFLKLMGASLALAGLSACTRQPEEKIVPYVQQPEQIIPGKPLFFATAMTLSGFASGILAESHMGRPTKIEGNPEHPASLGATDAITQASVLGLYDPDRSQAVMNVGNITSWSAFFEIIRTVMAIEKQNKNPGSGLRILTETISSPTLGAQLTELLKQYPAMKWHQYEPNSRDQIREGSRLAFGEIVNTYYKLDQADVVLSLDSDFLNSGPGSVRYSRDFMSRRKLTSDQKQMNRLYVAESMMTNTGAVADHRFRVRPDEISTIAFALAAELNVSSASSTSSAPTHKWIAAVARDLRKHSSACAVIAGDGQPPEVHAIVHSINESLGNMGKTVICTEPVEQNPVNQLDSLRELVSDMQSGRVSTLIILGGNPVFNAPADLGFTEAMSKVGLRVHLSLYSDETSNLCHWHVPETHFLESWSDARAYDGTASIVQPLIAPLYDGCRSVHEFISAMIGRPDRKAYDSVREYWKGQTSADFEPFWRKSVHDGWIEGTAFTEKAVKVNASGISQPSQSAEGMQIIFRADPTIYDGRFANNGWLQELQKPLTTLTWDNAVFLSPYTASKLGVNPQDVIGISVNGRQTAGPVFILPGHADDCATLHFGYGRSMAGKVGNGAGFDVFAIRNSSTPWLASGAKFTKSAKTWQLATTQLHHSMEGRAIVRNGTLEDYLKDPEFAKEEPIDKGERESMIPDWQYKGYAWGMAIDLNACTGCNACVVACVSENNIAVVGKDQVARGREMHWIRVDRYFGGKMEDPEVYHQPVLCQQCENAPCELVCPVGATVHSSEGLNDMVYNRCVGTRYCSNNCPYKVRRFNFLLYSDLETPSIKLQKNPDVTVRTRGVMEKCTYCVQRINEAKIDSEKQNRSVRDGEIQTACQQVCPSQAIVFGNINDPNSRVAKLKAEPRNYYLLGELNTRPRTTYLASVKNPNPEIQND
jgi:MoCo/4Fe-4S cofactor protein with predicted Tat translocation signal